ncbi:MAG: glycosyltransferase [Gammaproteobacteria bacterium]
MSRKVVLATVGSLGDLHPFIALGQALKLHGVNIVVASAPEYRGKVEAAGLRFHPLRPGFDELQHDLRMSRAELVRRVVRSSDFLFRKLVIPYVRVAYEDMMMATADADLVLASSLAFGARLAAEKRGIPWIAVVLQPMMFLSSYDPPVLPGFNWLSAALRGLGPAATRRALWLLKKAVNTVFAPLHALRAELQLPPVSEDPLFDGQFGAAGAIGLYSRLLGDVRPDYPQPTTIVGFATFDSEHGLAAGIDPNLAAFLDAGSAPLVFTLGSLMINRPGSFYRESVIAARSLGRRAVLLAGDQTAAELAHLNSPQAFVCPYAPHSQLFPRAVAIVHHGGIGTLAQALRAGRPQLIVPYFADQLDNAVRATRLGVAQWLAPDRYRAATASRDIDHLLGAASYLARARQVGDSVAAEDGAEGAARIVLDTLEQLGSN